MKSLEAVTNILDDQVNGYKKLLELLQKERTCLIDLNAECVEEISKAKDTLIFKLRLLEAERIRLMKDFSDDEISLQRLSEITGNKKFLDTRSTLVSLLQSINELNSFNKVLLERSLNYIKSSSNFFGFFDSNGSSTPKGTLISGEM